MFSGSVTDPGDFLKGEFLLRVQRNPSYSLRAFARDLGTNHAFLSQVINGRRGLSPARAQAISEKLGLAENVRYEFLQAVTTRQIQGPIYSRKRPRKPRRGETTLSLELEHFRLVSEWYHGAILELTELPDFRPSVSWISQRLGISLKDAKDGIQRLVRLGVLKTDTLPWAKSQSEICFPTTHADLAVRRFHEQTIEKAKQVLSSSAAHDYPTRDITGRTAAINPARIPKARKKIARFRKSLMAFLARGGSTEIYQVNVQLFPLSVPLSRATTERSR